MVYEQSGYDYDETLPAASVSSHGRHGGLHTGRGFTKHKHLVTYLIIVYEQSGYDYDENVATASVSSHGRHGGLHTGRGFTKHKHSVTYLIIVYEQSGYDYDERCPPPRSAATAVMATFILAGLHKTQTFSDLPDHSLRTVWL
ncbi:hypothetical protein EVAR_12386_1 [Eumeta japonica]|uniref:Uncharacterized protein n=1 Tax=Eumeta variegata TaxID=151549 RepID=A0A4C1TZ54_EUMVA|nr:hypothetical protein EVAR_12386_1 [Eumeta japonica]